MLGNYSAQNLASLVKQLVDICSHVFDPTLTMTLFQSALERTDCLEAALEEVVSAGREVHLMQTRMQVAW